ncbi:hypothetical protein ACFCVY_28795 [Streptomyces sp. NPDC056411]|uniref:hypothetical protein n=1 Tax=Streptomyces sp. NPDC056411 TaxID=3345813 RepID=UPI0035D77E85
MPLPPKCPTPKCDSLLWKDTTHTDTDWDNWRWWCCRCRQQWYPTADQHRDFRHGVSTPAQPGLAGPQGGPVYRDPRVPARR